MQHHSQLAGHPLLQRDHYEKLAVPFGIRGDGVPVIGIRRGSVDSYDDDFSWSSLLAKGPAKEVCFYIWSVFDRLCRQADGSGTMSTMDMFFTVPRWSLYWLWRGQWLDRDWTGQVYDFDFSAGSKASSCLADGHFGLRIVGHYVWETSITLLRSIRRSPEVHCFVRTLCVVPMHRNWPQHVDGLKANCSMDWGKLDKSRWVIVGRRAQQEPSLHLARGDCIDSCVGLHA